MSRVPPPPPPPAPASAIPPPPPAPETEPEVEVDTNHDLSSRVQGLTCPSCGGALEVDLGLRVIRCPYCKSPLLAVHELGTRRLAVEPAIEAERARQLARKWLATGIAKDPRLKREAPVGEAFLSFLPFYRVEADCVGFALGAERRRRTVGTGKHRRRQSYLVDVERRIERSLDRTYPALNVAEWGIGRVNLQGDPLVPFDPIGLRSRGMVFPPTGSETAVRETAVERFEKRCDPGRGLERVRFRWLTTLRERLSIIYYPIWVVRYRFKERSYQVLIDGEDGTVAYGKAPGNDFYRALMLVVTEAVALFFGTTALQLVGDHPKALLFVGFVVLVMLGWGFSRFRWGGVVIEGTGARKERGLRDALSEISSHRGRRRVIQELWEGRRSGGGR